MQFTRHIDRNASDETILIPVTARFSDDEYSAIDDWCKANAQWYHILMQEYVLFTHEDDVTLFLLAWSD